MYEAARMESVPFEMGNGSPPPNRTRRPSVERAAVSPNSTPCASS